MTDSDTQDAVSALAYRIRERDAAIRDGEDYPDAEVFAADYLTALRGRGWRPTEAKRVLPGWQRTAGPGARPPADLLAGLRADLEAKAAAMREPGDAA